jgi:uncharacterized phosphosugar-binding protein
MILNQAKEVLMINYPKAIRGVLDKIDKTQIEAIEKAGLLISQSLMNDGILHMFGTGHSECIAVEAFHRAGGLVPVNIIHDYSLSTFSKPRKSRWFERLCGLAELLLTEHDLRTGEVIIIISNSGINPVPIEMAIGARSRGLKVVAITSMDHSANTGSRHPGGKKLYQLSDVVVDNCGVKGDAIVEVPGLKQHVGSVSILAGVYILNCIFEIVVRTYLKKGVNVPVYASANIPGGDEFNAVLEAKYRDRIKLLQ